MSGPDLLDAPRAAVDKGHWQEALNLLADCGAEANSAAGLEDRKSVV